jgi:hypothetical protein
VEHLVDHLNHAVAVVGERPALAILMLRVGATHAGALRVKPRESIRRT